MCINMCKALGILGISEVLSQGQAKENEVICVKALSQHLA